MSVARINKWLETNQRSLKWLSDQSGVSYSHLYFTLRRKDRALTGKVIIKINKATGQNFLRSINS